MDLTENKQYLCKKTYNTKLKKKINKYLFTSLFLISLTNLFSQESTRIQIDSAGFFEKDDIKFSDATVLTRDNKNKVKISHEGVDLWCNQAYFYEKSNYIEAYGDVVLIQGDTINLSSEYLEYNGNTKIAFASGDVELIEPTSVLSTDSLYFDRNKQEAFYNNFGRVIKAKEDTIYSKVGRFFIDKKKYEFRRNVLLKNPKYDITTSRLDFYTENGHAYFYGPTDIISDGSNIYCELGFYDTNSDNGYFIKESRVEFNNSTIYADSIYFDRNINFASATNNIKIIDTINENTTRGNYAEIFKSKDSMFITQKAIIASKQDVDSLYIRSDTILITGNEDNRVIRAFKNARIFKQDLSGRADSIHYNKSKGLAQFININNKRDLSFEKTKKPILFNLNNQITGDTIHLKFQKNTNKIDSLIVYNNAFILEKDSLGLGFNQLSGKALYGKFFNDELKSIDIVKNAESIYYLRNDKQELVTIDRSKSAKLKVYFKVSEIDKIQKINQIDGKTYPENEFNDNLKELKGFNNRLDEKINSINELFNEIKEREN